MVCGHDRTHDCGNRNARRLEITALYLVLLISGFRAKLSLLEKISRKKDAEPELIVYVLCACTGLTLLDVCILADIHLLFLLVTFRSNRSSMVPILGACMECFLGTVLALGSWISPFLAVPLQTDDCLFVIDSGFNYTYESL